MTGVSCTPAEFCQSRAWEMSGGAVSPGAAIGTTNVNRCASFPTMPDRKWMREGLTRSATPATRAIAALGRFV